MTNEISQANAQNNINKWVVIKMNKLKVLNVEQGDSLILSIDEHCKYSERDIFIDLGNGRYDVSRVSNPNYKKILLLSHAHEDHIGGLSLFINSLNTNNSNLEEIWMPLFFNEVSIITEKILSLKGIQNVSHMNGSLLSAKNTASSFYLLKKLSKTTSIKMEGVYKGRSKCECAHIKIFQPTLDPALILGLSNNEIESYIEKLETTNYDEFYKWFTESDAKEVINFLQGNQYNNNDMEYGWSVYSNPVINEDLLNITSKFSYGLFLKLRKFINEFVEKPTNISFNKLYNSLKESSNNCSIVFKYINDDLDVLFTGDIGKHILDYLSMNNNDLMAKILKVPHHGSKYNLNKRTLKRINPSYAIISHGNGKFGRQIDPHPNIEVIRMLDDLKVKSLYTNDVEKNNKIIINRPNKIDVWPKVEYYDKKYLKN
ncbi:hypothetical protein ACIQ7N_21300 [Lysinibacillus sp. NPDC095746]|uniref:hypothetical protein n=1 Tax=Lysinibacillus sp. NPDC095746 TaxID=3364134 RepID=UPI003824EFEE